MQVLSVIGWIFLLSINKESRKLKMPSSVEQYLYFILIPCGLYFDNCDTLILHSKVEIYLSLCFRCAFIYCVV
ncbi:hypothetical protein HanXRQr2_Chr14g0622281 [Helianthus annuus]|uniref:Uncharacterized protein n=1 Tax=Helianthus annuus TaxID=4232 RepID=A0A9K3H5Y1_HELAN|nr:hypothetical protein HanXRQr2_Chr14g0622281 [Helianthus annuus]